MLLDVAELDLVDRAEQLELDGVELDQVDGVELDQVDGVELLELDEVELDLVDGAELDLVDGAELILTLLTELPELLDRPKLLVEAMLLDGAKLPDKLDLLEWARALLFRMVCPIWTQPILSLLGELKTRTLLHHGDFSTKPGEQVPLIMNDMSG